MDEKDFEVATDVFLKGADMVIEEDRSDCSSIRLFHITVRQAAHILQVRLV